MQPRGAPLPHPTIPAETFLSERGKSLFADTVGKQIEYFSNKFKMAASMAKFLQKLGVSTFL